MKHGYLKSVNRPCGEVIGPTFLLSSSSHPKYFFAASYVPGETVSERLAGFSVTCQLEMLVANKF